MGNELPVLAIAADLLEDPDWRGPRRGGRAALRAICCACPDDDPADLDGPIQVALAQVRDEVGQRLSTWDVPRAQVVKVLRRVGNRQGQLL